MIGEPIADDDILDPIVNNAHRIQLKEGAQYPSGQYRSFAAPYILAAKGHKRQAAYVQRPHRNARYLRIADARRVSCCGCSERQKGPAQRTVGCPAPKVWLGTRMLGIGAGIMWHGLPEGFRKPIGLSRFRLADHSEQCRTRMFFQRRPPRPCEACAPALIGSGRKKVRGDQGVGHRPHRPDFRRSVCPEVPASGHRSASLTAL